MVETKTGSSIDRDEMPEFWRQLKKLPASTHLTVVFGVIAFVAFIVVVIAWPAGDNGKDANPKQLNDPSNHEIRERVISENVPEDERVISYNVPEDERVISENVPDDKDKNNIYIIVNEAPNKVEEANDSSTNYTPHVVVIVLIIVSLVLYRAGQDMLNAKSLLEAIELLAKQLKDELVHITKVVRHAVIGRGKVKKKVKITMGKKNK